MKPLANIAMIVLAFSLIAVCASQQPTARIPPKETQPPTRASATSAASPSSSATPPTGRVVVVPTVAGDGSPREVSVLLDVSHLKVAAITLRRGTTLPVHTAPVPVTIHVVEGAGVIHVAGQPVPVQRGTLISLAANEEHDVVPAPGSDMVVLVHYLRGGQAVAPAPVSTPPAPAEHKAITTDTLEPYECGTITRLHTLGGVFLASQPKPEDFAQAKKGGVKTVINLRHASEIRGFDEQKVVEGEGLAYIALPWDGPGELTDDVFDEAREHLNAAQRPILLHCASANRVGAVWLPYRVLDGGVSWDAALAEAKTVGLRSRGYVAKAKDYIKRHGG